ncbi:MAG: HEPN domain-containing protein [Marinilabiliaceae bacterium]|nr:HEPN domain-containing protein [Marinilabiliaceae bacterium]
MQTHAIFTHDLLRLASKLNLPLTTEQEEWLDEISTFNINARYDSYKKDFQRLCTKAFANKWIERIEKLRQWLILQL